MEVVCLLVVLSLSPSSPSDSGKSAAGGKMSRATNAGRVPLMAIVPSRRTTGKTR